MCARGTCNQMYLPSDLRQGRLKPEECLFQPRLLNTVLHHSCACRRPQVQTPATPMSWERPMAKNLGNCSQSEQANAEPASYMYSPPQLSAYSCGDLFSPGFNLCQDSLPPPRGKIRSPLLMNQPTGKEELQPAAHCRRLGSLPTSKATHK